MLVNYERISLVRSPQNRYTLWVTLDQRSRILANKLEGERTGPYLRRMLQNLQVAFDLGQSPDFPLVEAELQAKQHRSRMFALSFRIPEDTVEFVTQWRSLLSKENLSLEQTLLLLLVWAARLPQAEPAIKTSKELLTWLRDFCRQRGSSVISLEDLFNNLSNHVAIDTRARSPGKLLLWELYAKRYIQLHSASPKHRPDKRNLPRYKFLDGRKSTAYSQLELLPRATTEVISSTALCNDLWNGELLPLFPLRVVFKSHTMGYAVPQSMIPLNKIEVITVTSLTRKQYLTLWRSSVTRLGKGLDGIIVRGFNGVTFTIVASNLL